MLTTLLCNRCHRKEVHIFIRKTEDAKKIVMVWQCRSCGIMNEKTLDKKRFNEIMAEYSRRKTKNISYL